MPNGQHLYRLAGRPLTTTASVPQLTCQYASHGQERHDPAARGPYRTPQPWALRLPAIVGARRLIDPRGHRMTRAFSPEPATIALVVSSPARRRKYQQLPSSQRRGRLSRRHARMKTHLCGGSRLSSRGCRRRHLPCLQDCLAEHLAAELDPWIR